MTITPLNGWVPRSRVRFLGDPNGYDVDLTPDQATRSSAYWVVARIGVTSTFVMVDLGKAYLVEDAP